MGLDDVYKLVERVTGCPELFELVISENEKNRFQASIDGGRVKIVGNNELSVAVGANFFLKDHCNVSVSHEGMADFRKPKLNPDWQFQAESRASCRYYMNYCTFGYSTAFWDWNRWEKELDWMALNGVNLPLAMVGAGAVWKNTLQQLGFSLNDVKAFIAGPGYTPWWLMGNMSGWGGPTPDAWIDRSIKLQQKILERMRNLGMEPVLQLYYGMIPHTATDKYSDIKFIDSGQWYGFHRPLLIDPCEKLFSEAASIFYQEQERLFGKCDYFAGDLFHEDEGKSYDEVDIVAVGRNIQKAMLRHNPDATWVIQAWQVNPREELLSEMKKDNVLICDLASEMIPQWEKRKGFGGRRWTWNIVTNYGGTSTMFGPLSDMIDGYQRAIEYEKPPMGLGCFAEGIDRDNCNFELLFEMPWWKEKVDVADWVRGYITRRYGQFSEQAMQCWQMLLKTVYASSGFSNAGLSTLTRNECIVCARPSFDLSRTSTWGTTEQNYDVDDVAMALFNLLECKTLLVSSDAYKYDVVDISRQLLADLSLRYCSEMLDAYRIRDAESFDRCSGRFINLIIDMDRLVATRKEFLLGSWIEQARSCGDNPEHCWLYELNAKRLVTVWGSPEADLFHDYAHKQWAGLIESFYLPRWQMFVDNLRDELAGRQSRQIDFREWEDAWCLSDHKFAECSQGSEIAIAEQILQHYGGELLAGCKTASC